MDSVKVPDTPWTLARTADGQILYFNAETKKSQWNLPEDLNGVDLPELPTTPAAPKRVATEVPEQSAPKRLRVGEAPPTGFAALQDSGIPPVISDGASGAVPSELPHAEPEEVEEMDEDEALLAAAMAEEAELEEQQQDTEPVQPMIVHAPYHGAPPAHMPPPPHGVLPPPAVAAQRVQASVEEWNSAQFCEMLRQHNVGAFSSWDHEVTKFRDDHRFKALKPKTRRTVFENFQMELAKKDKERLIHEKETSRNEFTALLDDAKLSTRSTFQAFKTRFARDPRFKSIEKMKDKMKLFNDYVADLKNPKAKRKPAAASEQSSEERRLESVRLREAEVHREQVSPCPYLLYVLNCVNSSAPEQATLKRERDRAANKLFETDQETVFRQMLLDIVRNPQVCAFSSDLRAHETVLSHAIGQVDWESAEDRLRLDSRWDSLFALDASAKRRLFDEYLMNMSRKKRDAFAAALDSALGLTIGTTWDEARAIVCTDPRFVRFSDDEAEKKAEYDHYIRARTERARKDFRELLTETRMITHETHDEVNDDEGGEAKMRDIHAVLARDSRYSELDSVTDVRDEILTDYLAEKRRLGAPLPPTADLSMVSNARTS